MLKADGACTAGFLYAAVKKKFDSYRYFLWLRLAFLHYIWYSYSVKLE